MNSKNYLKQAIIMEKQKLIRTFVTNHEMVLNAIDLLTEQEFNYHSEGKWSAGQQLQHLLLTIQPFSTVLIRKDFILDKFGPINRAIWDEQTVFKHYLSSSRKAPEQFIPDDYVFFETKKELMAAVLKNVKNIQELLLSFSDAELDTLTLPHPLVGRLTIREMFYLMSYHPLHHLKQIKEQLLEKDA